MNAEDVKAKILAAKGNYVKVRYRSEPKPCKQFKGVHLEKVSQGVIRAGINYENLKSVKEAIDAKERPPVGELPFGSWFLYPYIIERLNNEGLLDFYLRMYPSLSESHKMETRFYANGKEVTREAFAVFLAPAAARDLLNPTPVECFNIKLENLLDIEE